MRCDQKVGLAEADLVGAGYRCPACTTRAEIERLTTGIDDIDGLDPQLRAQLARRARRRARSGSALLAALLTPMMLAWVLVGPGLAVLSLGTIGFYFSGLAIDMILDGRKGMRQYGARIPEARVRQLSAR